MLYLVLEKLSKVVQVHFRLLSIYNCNSSFYFNVCIFFYIFNRCCNIRKFADS